MCVYSVQVEHVCYRTHRRDGTDATKISASKRDTFLHFLERKINVSNLRHRILLSFFRIQFISPLFVSSSP